MTKLSQKSSILSTLGVLLMLTAGGADAESAAEHNFYESAEAIVKALEGRSKPSQPAAGTRSRSMFSSGTSTRALKRKKVAVMQMDAASGKARKVVYETGNETGSANLKIEFDFNSADIRDSSRQLLGELGKALGSPSLKGKQITIAGHTDSTGDDAYNQELSMHRAKSIGDYLVQHHNIDKGRLDIIGFGEVMPLVDNTTRKNRQLNRRVEIISK